MSSRGQTPFNSKDTSREPSAAPLSSTGGLPNAFSRMQTGSRPVQTTTKRDPCRRPEYLWNSNYNPFELPRVDLPRGYSPYEYREPMFDDREAVVARLPKRHTLAPAPKRPRTQWVWKLGYALVNHSIGSKPTMWHCRHCSSALYIIIMC